MADGEAACLDEARFGDGYPQSNEPERHSDEQTPRADCLLTNCKSLLT